MSQQRILLFNGNQVTACLWHNSQMQQEGHFLPHEEGLHAFSIYLQQQKKSLFYWLADIAEESFQLEEIPCVQGRDRAALITRRLKQYFYGTPLSTALSLGRSSTGRRDEKVLFAALTRPEAMAPWIDVIREQEVTLTGIYSASLILASSAPRWLKTEQPTLLITQTSSGVHQSFFVNKNLQFSRLTPLASLGLNTHQGLKPNDLLPDVTQTILTESVKTYQYLVGQRQIKPRTPIQVAVLLTSAQRRQTESQCQNTDLLEFDFLDFDAITQREKIKPASHAQSAASSAPLLTLDQLLMHCLLAKPPAQQFAPEPLRHLYRLWQFRRALTAIAIISLVGGLLFTLKTAVDTHQLQEETSIAIAQTTSSSQRYNALLASLPQTNISPDNLRAIMARYESLQKHTTDLGPLLMQLSQVLNNNPAIELSNLEWKIEPTLSLPPGTRINPIKKVGAGETAAALISTPSTQPEATNGQPNGQPVVTLKVSAQLPLSLSADLRAQKIQIEQFAQQLKNAQTQVYLLAMPFDVESGKPLKNLQNSVDTTNTPAPGFTVLLVQPQLTSP